MATYNGLPVVSDKTSIKFGRNAEADSSYINNLISDLQKRDSVLYDFITNFSDVKEYNDLSLFMGSIVWGLLRDQGYEDGVAIPTVSDKMVSSGLMIDETLGDRLLENNPNILRWIAYQDKINMRRNDNSRYIAGGGLWTYSLLEQQAALDHLHEQQAREDHDNEPLDNLDHLLRTSGLL